jgi:hypothetical protein
MTKELTKENVSPEKEFAAQLAGASRRAPFGPVFFLTQLKGLVRDCCPDSAEALPQVQLHLYGEEVFDLCHVIGLTPAWVVLAVYDDRDRSPDATKMRTELVPYEVITRVTIRGSRKTGGHALGFNSEYNPHVIAQADLGGERSPEEALRILAQASPSKETLHHPEKKP